MFRFVKNYYLIALAALLLSLSRLPLYLGWLVFFAFVPLLSHIERREHKAGEWIFSALLFAFIQIALVFYWIGSVTFGGLVGIWLLFALFYFIAFVLLQRIWYRLPSLRMPAFVSIFISFEFLQNFSQIRFPWWNIGYALSSFLALLQALDIGGMSLLALLILSLNYLFFRVLQRDRRAWIGIGIIFIVWYAYGNYRLLTLPLTEEDVPIAVMQPSIKADDKWDDMKYPQILARYAELCEKASAIGKELIIFPEAAIPSYLLLDSMVRADLNTLIQDHQIDIFTGFPHAERAPADYPVPYYSYNAASLFTKGGGHQDLYYKNILVPVGERMLWLEHFPFLWKLEFGQANWEFGTEIPRYHYRGKNFSPSICYELAFPHFFQRANFNDGKGGHSKADFHVNITNDAWFGTSYGPWLHGIMAKYRAIESRIQVYRSANTGISMIVDPKGQILASTKLFEICNISAPLYTCAARPLYTRIYRYPWGIVAIMILLAILSFLTPRRVE
ncbi:MAG: apolipoprotein N-acyltransferase [Candidatus Cloacimonetes bacterium]|nr:apolipoprotein N-acyltransferase [Candidatus Cloacimonadota bacterium]